MNPILVTCNVTKLKPLKGLCKIFFKQSERTGKLADVTKAFRFNDDQFSSVCLAVNDTV